MRIPGEIVTLISMIPFILCAAGVVYGLARNLSIDIGYINGILTASSILFGFWIIVISRKPDEKTAEKPSFELRIIRGQYELTKKIFFGNFFLFLGSVLSVYLGGLGILSSVVTFSICTISFYWNAFLLILTLYHIYFYEST